MSREGNFDPLEKRLGFLDERSERRPEWGRENVPSKFTGQKN